MRIQATLRLQAASMVTLRVYTTRADKGVLEFRGEDVSIVDESGRTILTLTGGAALLKGYKKAISIEFAKGVKTTPYTGVKVERVTKGVMVNSFDVTAPMGNIKLARVTVSK